MQFKPVLVLALRVREAIRIRRHQLVNDDWALFRKGGPDAVMRRAHLGTRGPKGCRAVSFHGVRLNVIVDCGPCRKSGDFAANSIALGVYGFHCNGIENSIPVCAIIQQDRIYCNRCIKFGLNFHGLIGNRFRKRLGNGDNLRHGFIQFRVLEQIVTPLSDETRETRRASAARTGFPAATTDSVREVLIGVKFLIVIPDLGIDELLIRRDNRFNHPPVQPFLNHGADMREIPGAPLRVRKQPVDNRARRTVFMRDR